MAVFGSQRGLCQPLGNGCIVAGSAKHLHCAVAVNGAAVVERVQLCGVAIGVNLGLAAYEPRRGKTLGLQGLQHVCFRAAPARLGKGLPGQQLPVVTRLRQLGVGGGVGKGGIVKTQIKLANGGARAGVDVDAYGGAAGANVCLCFLRCISQQGVADFRGEVAFGSQKLADLRFRAFNQKPELGVVQIGNLLVAFEV